MTDKALRELLAYTLRFGQRILTEVRAVRGVLREETAGSVEQNELQTLLDEGDELIRTLETQETHTVFVLGRHAREPRRLANLDGHTFGSAAELNAFLDGIALAEGYASVFAYDTRKEAEAALMAAGRARR